MGPMGPRGLGPIKQKCSYQGQGPGNLWVHVYGTAGAGSWAGPAGFKMLLGLGGSQGGGGGGMG